jgi:hypothetical protein
MTDPKLEGLERLLGSWITLAQHPMLPGVDVHGSAELERLEGERFLIQRSRNDHPDFPDALSVIGYMEQDRVDHTAGRPTQTAARLCMKYFDSRGVFRDYDVSIDSDAWKIWRDAPGFSQRFTGSFADGGNTIAGLWQLCQDDQHWKDDLRITYRRKR